MNVKFLKIIFIFTVLAGVLLAGIYLRIIKPDFYSAKAYNVNAYYFYKSQYLNDFGRLPKKDIWGFAPEIFPENVPPLLAYANVGLYKFVKLFKPEIDFYNFAMLFPVIIYAAWALFGFLFIYYLFESHLLSLFFVGLLTAMPLVFNLTGYGQYTEEPLGAFLFFFSLIFLIKFTETSKALFFWLAILFITAFYLAWQQFPIFLFGLFVVGLIQVLIIRQNRSRLIIGYLLLIILPLFFGYLISRYLMDIDYSPILMLHETYLGVKDMGSEFIRTAMYRQDWRNLYLGEFVDLIGLVGWILIGAGFLKSILNLRKPRRLVIFIFSILTLAVAIKFFKSRYLALAPLLLISSLGVEFFMERSREDWAKFVYFIRVFFQKIVSAVNLLKRRISGFIPVKLFVLFGLAIIFIVLFLLFFRTEPRVYPKPKIIFSPSATNFEIGKEYLVEIKLSNEGGDSLSDAASFGGLHVEVENARVENITVWSDRGVGQAVIKPDAKRDSIYWFEAKYPGLKNGEANYLWFRIIPEKLPINFYYRGWLPGVPTFLERLKTMLVLRPEYRNWFENSWRNEKAIQRSPANSDLTEDFCLIKVFAAHKNIQNFRCFMQSFK